MLANDRKRGRRPARPHPVWLPLTLLLALSMPATAHAFRARSGFELGARLAIGLPYGKAVGNTPDIPEQLQLQVAPMIDLGFRVGSWVFVGAYGGFGPLAFTDKCTGCSGYDFRVGGQVHFHFRPSSFFDPWLGAGLGYELLRTDQGAPANRFGNLEGLDANLQLGLDLRPLRLVGVGLFVMGTVGQFVSQKVGGLAAGGPSGDIPDKAVHAWFLFGVRAVLNP